MMAELLIDLQNVGRRYASGDSTVHALRGVDIQIARGEMVAIIGQSGSGKSTLLHIAGLLEAPDSGEVYVNGAPTSQLPDIERTQLRRTDIGFVYQSHRLLPEFSALENVMMPQMIRGLKRF